MRQSSASTRKPVRTFSSSISHDTGATTMMPPQSSRTVAGTGNEPTKVVMERQVQPGAETRFQSWLRTLLDTACDFGGLEGSSVLTAGASGHYFILLRFASAERMQQWQDSPQLAALVREANTFSVAADASPIKTGLETWFTLP